MIVYVCNMYILINKQWGFLKDPERVCSVKWYILLSHVVSASFLLKLCFWRICGLSQMNMWQEPTTMGQ